MFQQLELAAAGELERRYRCIFRLGVFSYVRSGVESRVDSEDEQNNRAIAIIVNKLETLSQYYTSVKYPFITSLLAFHVHVQGV